VVASRRAACVLASPHLVLNLLNAFDDAHGWSSFVSRPPPRTPRRRLLKAEKKEEKVAPKKRKRA